LTPDLPGRHPEWRATNVIVFPGRFRTGGLTVALAVKKAATSAVLDGLLETGSLGFRDNPPGRLHGGDPALMRKIEAF